MDEQQLYIVEISIWMFGCLRNRYWVMVSAKDEETAIVLAMKAKQFTRREWITSVTKLCTIAELNNDNIVTILE